MEQKEELWAERKKQGFTNTSLKFGQIILTSPGLSLVIYKLDPMISKVLFLTF